jgi:putative membrane-bound dehydrogenase-like protein
MANPGPKGNTNRVGERQIWSARTSSVRRGGRIFLAIVLGLYLTADARAQDERPRSLDPRLKVELFAENPQIVTPTGIDVDHLGRVWAIESNTHFPPEGYKGHPSDRVLVLTDTDGDGKADRIVVFTDGLRHTMSVAMRPVWNSNDPATAVYIATRREIRIFFDDDGDDKADRSGSVVRLETKGDYPHNGLAGFAFDALGWMFFGFGENLGADYKIIGSDGMTLAGGGEGGNIYRCRPDGTKLERWATGFWNPHANCFDAFGRMFSVDNDPDSRPPCRLMHIIPGGDYGYRFRNGRAGLHPFTAWNGEIPGTLPMTAGTGEAPSGVLAYESDGLPGEYIGNLFATSWGDHRVDRFRLKAQGASFTSLAEPLIVGGENFRPVGIACAPDGSLYFTDWVKRDYNLHSHGRIWRISAVEHRPARAVVAARFSGGLTVRGLLPYLTSTRLDIRREAARRMATTPAGHTELLGILADRGQTERARVEALWALATRAGKESGIDLARADLFATCDSVAAAAGWLLGTPDLPMDREKLQDLAQALVGERIARRHQRLADGTALTAVLSRCKFGPNDILVKLALSVDDPFVLSVLVTALAHDFKPDGFARFLTPGSGASPRTRVAMLLAARLHNSRDESLAALGLGDHDPDVRRLAVQWAAEEKLTSLRPQVEAVFNSNAVTADLFMATLAALDMLDGGDPKVLDKTPPAKYVLPLLKDENRPAAVRAQALRLVNPNDSALDGAFLGTLLNGTSPVLSQESVRTLQLASAERAAPLLLPFAVDAAHDKQLRADALAGLAGPARAEQPGGAIRKLLADVMGSDDAALRLESLRAARKLCADDPALRTALLSLAGTLKPASGGVSDAEHELADQIALTAGDNPTWLPESIAALKSPRPSSKADWLAQLNRGRAADPDAGRRLFYHANGPGCSKCHTVNGRGGRVGPDLSRIVESMNRIQLIQSILEPSSEIAPQFVAWAFETTSGKVHTGMIVHENEGKTIIGDAEGKTTELKTIDIVQRVPQTKSVMPDKLPDLMTLQEFRDLIAFLESLK